MKYTKIEKKIYVAQDDVPSGYGDFVTDVVGGSRYVNPELPLGCMSMVVLQKKDGMVPTLTSPSVCSACQHRLPCGANLNPSRDYQFTPMKGKELELDRPFDLKRFERENEFVDAKKLLKRGEKPSPENLVWDRT